MIQFHRIMRHQRRPGNLDKLGTIHVHDNKKAKSGRRVDRKAKVEEEGAQLKALQNKYDALIEQQRKRTDGGDWEEMEKLYALKEERKEAISRFFDESKYLKRGPYLA
jgi:hypothetical protein